MAYLFGAKPISEPTLVYYQLNETHLNEITFENKKFSFNKIHLEISSAKHTIYLGINALIHCTIMTRQWTFISIGFRQ